MNNYYMNFNPQTVLKKDGKHYYIEGYASTIDKDLTEDIVDRSAQMDILDSIRGRTITLDLEHERFINKDGTIADRPHSGSIPIGKVVHAELRPKGVWIRAEINPHSDRFKNIWHSIKNKFLNAFSIAFKPIEVMTKETEAGVIRVIKRLNLYNIALTGEAANPNATFTPVMKSLLKNYKEANNMSKEIKNEETQNQDTNTKEIDLKSITKRLDNIENSIQTIIKNNELEDKINELGTRIDELEKAKANDIETDDPEDKDKDKDQDNTEDTEPEAKNKETTVKSKANSKIKLKSTIEEPKETKETKEIKTNTNVLDLF